MLAETSRGFVDTPASRVIRKAVAIAREEREATLVVGPPGVGKTMTLQRIAGEDRRARLMTATPAASRLRGFLTTVADVFSIHTARDSSLEIQRTLEYALQEPAAEGATLIIDEAQTLELEALKTAFYLSEAVRLPIAFVGNPAVLKRRRSEAAAFDQISDRLFYRETIEITAEDVQAFGVEFNLEGREAYALLVRFGLATSLRQVAALLRSARVRAGACGSILFPHLADALRLLRGMDVATSFIEPKEAGR